MSGRIKKHICTDRWKKSSDLGNVSSRRPKEHLIPILVQNPQAIRVLRHAQSAYIEERFGSHLCAFQIRRDVRNAGERRVRVVLFANAEELNRKHHLVASELRSKRGAMQNCKRRRDVTCRDDFASRMYKVKHRLLLANNRTKKNPRPKPGVLYSKRRITSAGCPVRLVVRPDQASGSAADSAGQASAGRRLVGRHPGRLGRAAAGDEAYVRLIRTVAR
jgi:hypothetical protein